MIIKQGIALLAVFGLSAAALAAPQPSSLSIDPAGATATQDGEVKLLRYVRVGPAGAKLRNIFDKKGLVLSELETDQILAVYDEKSGWLEVEVPGGFPVWVFGQFLRATPETNVYEVTGNNVLQRPRPDGTPASMPVRQKLFVRDRVIAIKRNDPSKPLAEDWVQVWAPGGVRAWVASTETQALPNGVSGTKMWGQAVLAERERRGSSDGRRILRTPGAGNSGSTSINAEAPAGAATEAAAQLLDGSDTGLALAAADELLAEENQNTAPNYGGVRAAYAAILAAAPAGATAEIVRGRMREVDARERAVTIREEFAAEAQAKLQEIESTQSAITQLGSERDPLENRYARRGWLERIERKQAEPLWVLRWGGEIVAEVTCSSGRYDLSVFEDYELGISGSFLPTAATFGPEIPPHVSVIDLARIEVLSGRSIRRR